MIYPKPYSTGITGNVIIGRSSLYNILEGTVTNDLASGDAIYLNVRALNEILLPFNTLPNSYQEERYQYVLLPVNNPPYTGYFWHKDVFENAPYRPIVPYHSYQCYGHLYNSYAVTAVNNIAPTGWRVPTKADIDALVTYAGGSSVGGDKLKGTIIAPNPPPRWQLNAITATGTTGFALYGGGYRTTSLLYNGFWGFESHGVIWYTTPTGTIACISNTNSVTYDTSPTLSNGYSIRCVKEDNSGYSTNGQTGTVADEDGNIYTTRCIGDPATTGQVWMTQNLATTKFRDGTSIDFIQTNQTEWNAATRPAYCIYAADYVGSTPWWVRQDNFEFNGRRYTMYKLKRIGLGAVSPWTAYPTYFKKYDYSGMDRGLDDPILSDFNSGETNRV